MASTPPEMNPGMQVLACIGNICLQWSLVETNLLAIVCAFEGMSTEKGFLIFGGLDMKPRCDLVINLASQPGIPATFAKRLRKVKVRIFDKLDEQRHQAVHSVQSWLPEKPNSVRFTMPRWKEPKRTQDKTPLELLRTAERLNDISNELLAIYDDIGRWKFRNHRPADSESEVPQPIAPFWLKAAENTKHRVLHLWRNLIG